MRIFQIEENNSNGPKSMQIWIGNEIFPQIFSGARAGHTCSGDFDRFTARAVGFIFSILLVFCLFGKVESFHSSIVTLH